MILAAKVESDGGVGVNLSDPRNYWLFYAPCPRGDDHFILADPADPTWEKTPPDAFVAVECSLCGYKGTAQTWKTGYVSTEERRQKVAYSESYPSSAEAGGEDNQNR